MRMNADGQVTGLALVLCRGKDTAKVARNGRVYDETGEEDSTGRRDADRMWFTIVQDKRPLPRPVVYGVNGQVGRVRAVLDEPWEQREQGKDAVPIGAPLSAWELTDALPGLPFALGDARPMIRGKIREYLALSSPGVRVRPPVAAERACGDGRRVRNSPKTAATGH
ncbi:hypothetical protein ACIGDI_18595 [Streptomyces sp. NPDC085900]|uniref:hypothetical protein n=1 Tax=Streptomyces sp. NPDC085900 TaxID=3365737 RepID=UPI0037CFBCFC